MSETPILQRKGAAPLLRRGRGAEGIDMQILKKKKKKKKKKRTRSRP